MKSEKIEEWIDSIISDLNDNTKSLEDCLRKTLVLSFMLKNDKLKTWVDNELNGYNDNVPAYRQVGIEIVGNLVQSRIGGMLRYTNHTIPFRGVLDPILEKWTTDGYDLINNVASIESAVKPYGDKPTALVFSLSPYLTNVLENRLSGGWVFEKAWIQISDFTLTATLSKIKTHLLQFLLNLNEEVGNKGDYSIMTNRETVDRLVEHTIGHIQAENVTFGTNYQTKGNQNNVVQGDSNTQQVSSSAGQENLVAQTKELISQLNQLLQAATDTEPDTKEDIALQVQAVDAQVNRAKPNFGVVNNALRIIESLLLNVATNQYTPIVTEAIHKLTQLTSGQHS